ncbi:glycosyltransferase family 2 protein [Paenibacillus gansuensis]|uniref:Glycosyltransferase family 2 protein n=1 Tax=Paenibacillus gansuensis TaxID=306542 RepID=A0ABW5PL06_9BACL
MTISVVLATKNKAEYLDLTLHCLSKQQYTDFELVICNDGSTDETENIIEKWRSKWKKFHYIKNDIPKGVATARNNALQNVSRDYVLFLDDDRLLLPDSLSNHVNINIHNRGSFVCGKRWELYTGLTPDSRIKILDKFEKGYIDGFRRHIEPMPRVMSEAYLDRGPGWPLRWYCVLTGNLSTSTELIQHYRFDPNFVRLQDLEMGFRAVKDGCNVIYSEQIESFHLAHPRKNYNEIAKETYKIFKNKHNDIATDLIESFFIGEICLHEYERQVLKGTIVTMCDCNKSGSRISYFTN